VNRTIDMTSQEAEEIVEEQADTFEKTKEYLIHRWENAPK